MLILGIESTCDETSAAIVEDGRKILSNIVASSAAMHEKYGGIVPEVAAREQIKVIIPMIGEACQVSGVRCQELDAIAIAYGPGLIGSLLIGTETARALALAWNKPLIGVNHLVGHIYANWLMPVETPFLEQKRLNSKFPACQSLALAGRQIPNLPKFPLIALVVSGGHTDLILMEKRGDFKWLGGTRDDSAGEAFDKVARMLGLGYPGGPEIELLATSHQGLEVSKFKLPRPMAGSGDFDFSFSGIKTAVVNRVKDEGERVKVGAIAYEFQEAVTDILVKKTLAAAKQFSAQSIVVGGGVAANSVLREKMEEAGKKNRIKIFFPPKSLSIDNGAMIAAAGFYEKNLVDPLTLRANPGLHF
ncbi:MAG: tRNA (adenosine(37)-N6)-threonylcarbamoyltransferase complex transferase subunit TsaD [Candidatus Curtissbacteria bacterium]|nr:tRNA (adenosine(37)-N6)-threonylcarbamoyltransferase complex transferase subunit TsaD [Candidatus Curtissbacteria bacterium]